MRSAHGRGWATIWGVMGSREREGRDSEGRGREPARLDLLVFHMAILGHDLYLASMMSACVCTAYLPGHVLLDGHKAVCGLLHCGNSHVNRIAAT